MRRQVLVTAGVARHQIGGLCAGLSDCGLEVVERFDLDDLADEATLLEGLSNAWAVIAGSEPYPRSLVERLPSLRAIARWGSGYDRIDVEAATQCGVAVLTAPGANAEPVADCALLLMLACVRRLRTVDAVVRSGAWRQPELTGDLTRATVGVVGLGAIGQAVVRRLRGFDCRVLGTDPAADPSDCREMGIELLSLTDLLAQADIITLHVPRTPATRGLIGARELGVLRPGAIVVNTSRGEVIDEEALLVALESGTLGGAGLDVFSHEPLPVDHPLTHFENVVLSGHAASFTALAAQRTAESVVENVRLAARGFLGDGCVNPDAWAQIRQRA
jgi:D-3-phosphoglycerate dehydrogenase / 2-oxoglutarate reductase